MFLLVLIPIIIGGAGWLTWQRLKANIVKCEKCGISSINNSNQCPFCGASMKISENSINTNFESSSTPANSATIDVTFEDLDSNKST